ncbi:MAG: hypothetical protein OEM01_00550 [Desulfobulbaceae bacterium]|nr:hypothetical protein [Desulfobulbaceae bacterium]
MKIERMRIASALALIMCLGVALRLYMSVKAFYSTFDTSTVGLMGLHILEGEFPLFYYGQNYMGALEAYTAALMFSIFGVSTVSLSMAPISFALGWIFATYLLFSKLFGRTGGIAAALCTSAVGWYGLWFSMGSYGGYSGFFFFGTVFIYLSLLVDLAFSRRAMWLAGVGLGVTAALGIWTNLQVLSYLMTGSIVLLVLLIKAGFDRKIFLPVAVAGVLGAAGFVPFVISLKYIAFASGTMDSPAVGNVVSNFGIMARTLPRLLIWPAHSSIISWVLISLCLVPPLLIYLYRLLRKERGGPAGQYVPVLFCAVFLVLYLPHPMASLGAARYLVPLVTMLICAGFASMVSYDNSRVSAAGWALLGLWVMFNVHGSVLTAQEKHADKVRIEAARDGIVLAAEKARVGHVMILGSEIDGNRGQAFTFHARDRIRFVSLWDERYEPASQSAELDPSLGYLYQERHREKVLRSFRLAGAESFSVEPGEWELLHHVEASKHAVKSVLPLRVAVTEEEWSNGRDSSLFDRDMDTGESIDGVDDIVKIRIDLGREVAIDRLWVIPGKGADLPDRYEVSVSMNGKRYKHVLGAFDDTVIPVYGISGRFYVMGSFARADLYTDGAVGRYIELEMARTQGKAVLSELVVFERSGSSLSTPSDEITRIHDFACREGIEFIAADRWLSSQLEQERQRKGSGPSVYPLYNARFKRTMIDRRIVLGDGFCWAVPSGLADETESLLTGYRPSAEVVRRDFETYSLLIIKNAGDIEIGKARFLYWNGHILTRMEEKAD